MIMLIRHTVLRVYTSYDSSLKVDSICDVSFCNITLNCLSLSDGRKRWPFYILSYQRSLPVTIFAAKLTYLFKSLRIGLVEGSILVIRGTISS